MTDMFQFELVSPEKLLVSKPVVAVILPGSDGQFTVLPRHAPLIATLQAGMIEVYERESGAGEMLFVKSGLAEVRPDGLIVLAEEVVDPATVDRDALARELAKLEQTAEMAQSEAEKDSVEQELIWRRTLTASLQSQNSAA